MSAAATATAATSATSALMAAPDMMDDAYLSDLLSYSLERLDAEPEKLDADASRATESERRVACEEYRAFVASADCYATVRGEIRAIGDRLDAMRDALPTLRAGCEAFAAKAESIARSRALVRATSNHQSALLDVLEAPTLQDQCARHGNYDEALDLENFVRKLASAHADDVAVVKTLAENAAEASSAMRAKLVDRLRGAAQLPECLRVVGYLRRMCAYEEDELRDVFLRAREAHIADAVDELETSGSPYEYVKRLTDAHRVHCFDVVMQYRAIFADDDDADDHVGNGTGSGVSSSFSSLSIGGRSRGGGGGGDGGLLYSWSAHRIASYLRALESTLPKIDEGGALASVHEHCAYCGASLARVGLDFRASLPPMFSDAAMGIYRRRLDDAVGDFEKVTEQHRWAAAAAVGAGAGARDAGDAASAGDASSSAPPYALLEHVPVAAFTNGVLAALNELRHCAAPSLRTRAAEATRDAIRAAADAMARTDASVMGRETLTRGSGQRAAFVGACDALTDVAAPYLAGCFGRLFKGGERMVDARGACEELRLALRRRANE
jgi:hypothetical protein